MRPNSLLTRFATRCRARDDGAHSFSNFYSAHDRGKFYHVKNTEDDTKPDQIHKWAEELEVSPEELRAAIERVGPISSEVRKFLKEGDGKRA